MTNAQAAHREKMLAALSSVGAAIGLTGLKLVVGLLTGSLGILAEAAHSGLDLVAALMTLFAVRLADRPADASHLYGHGKVENLSALFEAGLLLLTAAWVIYEATLRLLYHEGHLEITFWAFAVMFVSIAVDATRSRVLLRVARKLGSQALEADALHFSTDIWSSAVVIAGLLIVYLATALHLPAWMENADAVAAIGVSGIVLYVGLRLAKQTIDALLDRTPEDFVAQLQTAISTVEGVTDVRRVRVRRVGNKFFADVVIGAPRTHTFEQIHEISEQVERAGSACMRARSPDNEIDIVVHVEPAATPGETLTEQIHYLAELQGLHAHDIHVREVEGYLEADFDIELHSDMNLQAAHAAATRLEQAILQGNKRVSRVTTHLEAPNEAIVPRDEVTDQYASMAERIQRIADKIAGKGSAHEVHLYRALPITADHNGRQAEYLDLVLHTTFDAHAPLSKVHIKAEEIKRALRQAYPRLDSVVIHTEPRE